jgi:hypothetical protein
MHTTHDLTSETFEYRRHGAPVDRDEVMPSLAIDGRLGVVTADPADGLGAGNFVLACVTAFYDGLSARSDDFYAYPDYYTFQASPDPLDYLEFDVWPDHKNVAVDRGPEPVLRAVNDRAITVLLVPDVPATDPDLEDVTRRSAERRIDACYLYAPDGDLTSADFSIRLPWETVGPWYRETVAAAGVDPGRFTPADPDDASLTQQFRELDLEDALRRLSRERP